VITRVRGIRVGNWTDPVGLTGCTVVLCPPGTVGSGEVRGGAPGTRETDLLRPGTLVQEVNAVLLTGGSAFGLAAADGVMRYLEERGVGFDTGVARVPIVPAAVLFDLGVGDAAARPDAEAGYLASVDADSAETQGRDVAEGNVGAGTGATVAKLHGRAVKGGLGSASAQEDEVVVGALAAVNALGEILDEHGDVLASAGGPEPATEDSGDRSVNTTLVVVATNARLSKERAHLVAVAAHEGIDAAVRPAHTLHDGDTAFSLATGTVDADQRRLEDLAVRAVADAIRRAVLAAESVAGIPACRGR
jgi:L-aminopeptidase/D-esterase-like protein